MKDRFESTEDRNKFHGVELAAQLQTSFKARLVYTVKPHPYKLVKKVQVLQRVPSSSIPIGRGCKLKPCISDGSNPSWNTNFAGLVQMDRATVYEAVNRGSNPLSCAN